MNLPIRDGQDETIEVHLSMVGGLRRLVGVGRERLTVPSVTRIRDVVSVLSDRHPELGELLDGGDAIEDGRVVLLLNGRNLLLFDDPDRLLQQGDKLVLTHPLGGG